MNAAPALIVSFTLTFWRKGKIQLKPDATCQHPALEG